MAEALFATMEESKEDNPNNLMRTALDELAKYPVIPLPLYNNNYDTQTLAIKLQNNPKYLSEIGYHGNFGM